MISALIDSRGKKSASKFTLFSDLSFARDDDDFGAQGILEGSVSARTKNLAVRDEQPPAPGS